MKKIILHSTIILLAFGGTGIAHAQTDVGTSVPVTNEQPPQQPLLQRIQSLIEQKRGVRVEAHGAMQAVRQETRTAIKDVRMSNASSTDKNMEIKNLRENMASSTKDIKDKMKQDRGAITEQQRELVGTKTSSQLQLMGNRIQATIDREETIIAKIVSRISKIKSAGGNTTDAEKMLSDATMHITEAKTAMVSLQNLVATTGTTASTTTSISKETITSLRKASENVEKHLREAHSLLLKTIETLKATPESANATSTKTN